MADNTGTANSPYNAVVIETVAGEISAAPLNTSLSNLDTAIQSHTHPVDTKVGWDSMKADFRPPDTGDSTNRWRLVCGVDNSVVLVGGTKDETITFSSASQQGDPSFASAPYVTVTCKDTVTECNVTAVVVTTTSAIVRVTELDGGASNTAVSLHWMAYGKIA